MFNFVQSFPEEQEAANGRRLLQQPRCGADSGAVAFPAESKHAFYPTLLPPSLLCQSTRDVGIYCMMWLNIKDLVYR